MIILSSSSTRDAFVCGAYFRKMKQIMKLRLRNLKCTLTLLFMFKICGLHLVSSQPTIISDIETREIVMSESVQSLFRQLNKCHLQIYLDPQSDVKEHRVLHSILNFQSNVVTYSIDKRLNIQSAYKAWEQVKYSFIQRANCVAHVFIEGGFWNTKSNQGHLSLLAQESSWSFSPDYVLFLIDHHSFNIVIDRFWAMDRSHYLGFCYAVVRMSVLYAITPAWSSIWPVTQVQKLPIEISKYFQGINMNRKYIASDLSEWEVHRNLKTCDYSTDYGINHRPPTVEECIFYELSKSMNFSYQWKGNGYAYVRRRRTLSLDYLNGDIKPNRRQIVEHGLVFDQWGYMVAKERLSSYDTALVGPFDVFTWLGILFSVLGLSFVFILAAILKALQKKVVSKRVIKIDFDHNHYTILDTVWHEKSLRYFLYFIGSLLDQSVMTIVSKLKLWGKANNVLATLWILWCFCNFLLGQLYKGKMFSFLTRSPEPEFPTSFQSLAESGILIWTFSGFYKHEYLNEVMNAKDITFPSYYNDFNHSLKYIPEWLNGLRRFAANLYLQTNKHILPNGTTIDSEEIPESFASFDYLKHIYMHKQVLNLYSPEKWSSPVVPVFGFMSTMPWTLNKNYFYPLFRRGLSQIYEGGLYNRWDRYHDSINGLDNFYWVKHLMEDKGVHASDIITSVPDEDKWHNYYYNSDDVRTTTQHFQNSEAVSVLVLKVVWFLSAALFVVSGIFLILELLWNKYDTKSNVIPVMPY